MLAYERTGAGPALLLLHGTNASHAIWAPVVPALAEHAEVLAVDVPGHGASPPGATTPPGWAREVAALLDELGLDAPAVVGHSTGGWAALELAKLGRAGAVLALAPAGLWRRHSPLLTDLGLQAGWRLGRLTPRAMSERTMRSRLGRRLTLGGIAARPADVPAEEAVALARTAAATAGFPEHFRATRRLRFTGGDAIAPSVPVQVVWADRDRVARRRASRHADELPAHAVVETWERCGHTLMWDAPDRVVEAALGLLATGPGAGRTSGSAVSRAPAGPRASSR